MSQRSRTAIIIAGLATLSILALLGVQTWANVERNSMPQFLLVHAAPDGRVFVPLGDSLYVESPAGESLEVIPLSRFGIQYLEGDFAVLSDDTLLLKAEQRQGGAPLQRCALKTGVCRPLDGEGNTFRAGVAFRLAVDERNQRIRVADTVHHRLLLLDMEGRILRELAVGFRYPSSMARVAEDEFLVSDTNHGRVVRISGREDEFGKQLGQFPITGWSKQPAHTYPKGVAIPRDGSRWIVLTDSSINHGELYRQGSEDGTATPIPLPEGTDTLWPESLMDSVLLPDEGTYRIHRFALDGTRMPDFGSPRLEAALAGQTAHFKRLERIFKGSYLGLFVAVPLLGFALWLHRKATAAEQREGGPVELPVGDDAPYRNPESLLRQQRGEYLFQRRLLVLGSRDARRSGLMLAVFFVLTLFLPLLMMGVLVSLAPFANWKEGPMPWLLGVWTVVLLFSGICLLQSQKHERLSLDTRGLRYVSLFSGPLAFLERLVPGWEMEWRELEHITLNRVVGGIGGAWYYELRDRSGGKRRINALSWRLVGEDEAGLTIQDASRYSAEYIQAAIRKTRLHRQLAEHMPELSSPRGEAPLHG